MSPAKLLLSVVLGAVLAVPAIAQPAAGGPVFLVHLPSAPIEEVGRLAAAVDGLAAYLSRTTGRPELEVRLFRRHADAASFFADEGDRVVLLLTDPSFLLDLEAAGLRPVARLRRGAGTYRRLIVVKADGGENGGGEKLVDLRGKTLAVVETAGDSVVDFLRQAVFEGEVDPTTWFAGLERISDDFSAASAVLFGQVDAALVAEHNPLVESHLGNDLRQVWRSPPLSLPVLTVRESSFTAAERGALASALAATGDDPQGRDVLATLEADGFEALAPGASARALALPAAGRGKEMEIALPTSPQLDLPPPRPPAVTELPFVLTVDLPELPRPEQ